MPDICEITGVGVDITGAVLPNATFRIERQSGQTVPSGDTFSVADTFLAVTDADGILGRIENGSFVAGIDLVQGFNYVVTPRGADDFRDLRSFSVAVPEGTTSGTINELMILSPLPPIDQAAQAVIDANAARDEARLWATEQEDTPVSTDPDEFSAFHWAQKAQESADLVDLGALNQAVQDSEDNATLAMRWATEDEDVPVSTDPDMFSAFHWAMKSEEFAESVDVPEFATEPQALAGTADDVIMSPLRTAQVLDDDLVDYASQADAEAGTDNDKLMTPLRTAQAIAELAPEPDRIPDPTDPDGTVAGTVTSGDLKNAVEAFAAAGGLSNIEVFTTSGTFSVPEGVDLAYVIVLGGGGGGGGINAANSNQSSVSGAGGAGGVAQGFVDLSSESSVSVTVGSQGNGGSNFSNGQSGGTSSFLGFSAGGGGGGNSQSTAGSGAVGNSGSGGSASAPGGVAVPGMPGGRGVDAGGSQSVVSGAGGSTPYGAGGAGRAASGNGNNGTGYGSGGSGAASRDDQGNNRTGGNGAPGVVIVYY